MARRPEDSLDVLGESLLSQQADRRKKADKRRRKDQKKINANGYISSRSKLS